MTGAERAIITVSYGSGAELAEFLASVPVATSVPVHVVVADNLPEASTAAIARESGAAYLPLPGNPGYGGAVNAAVRTLPAEVEWILISNPDVVLGPDALDVLVATASDDPSIGSVGPLVRNSDRSIYPSARNLPSLRTGVGHALFGKVWPSNPWTRRYHAAADSRTRRDAGWLSGSCLLVRRTAFERNAGFDDGFFMYFEDVDLGYRLGRDGWRNVYQPAAEVVHSGAHSTDGGTSRAMVIAHHESARRFINKKYRHPLLWPIRKTISIGLRIRASWELRH